MSENQIVPPKPELSAAKRALLAKWARGGASDGGTVLGERIPRRQESGPASLSFGQQRIWFLNELEPSSPLYNVPIPVRLCGNLNPEVLQKSLNAIVARHEALRTRFIAETAEPVQFIEAPTPVPMRVIDLTRELPIEREAKAMRLLKDEARRPFDFSRDLMMRALLLRLGECEWMFLVTMHHIASDAWSWRVVCKDLVEFYPAFESEQPASLPPLSIQYPDYAAWQLKWWNDGAGKSQLAYWRKQLADAPTCLELPTDRPRPAVQTFRGTWEYLTLPRHLGDRLKSLSQREGVTLFMTMLAAFQTLLHHYTGSNDILVGSPVAGRDRVELERLIGLFVNTLVLRTSLEGNPRFRDLLRRVRDVVLDALAHQELPLEKLVEDLQPERSAGHSPLIQVMFALEESLAYALQLPGITATSVRMDNGTSKFDITLTVLDDGETLTCAAEYNTDLFDRETIHRMLGHYQRLLEGIIAEPDRRVSDLPLSTEDEQRRLTAEWNDTQVDLPGPRCAHQLFEEQVRKTPNAVAVIFENETLTYAKLNERANQLAHHLRSLGIGPEKLVGVSLERSFEMVVAFLGVWKAGGAYVPIDPSYPEERLRYLLNDSRVQVLLTQQRWLGCVRSEGVRTICLDTEWQRLASESIENPVGSATEHNLAYVIYTSGSTGQPKGAMNSHRGLSNRLLWMLKAHPLTAKDRMLQKTPFNFDVSVWEFFWPLIAGARLVLARPGGHQDASYLVDLIENQEISAVHFVPSMLRAFLEHPNLKRCSTLRKVFCSGEALSFDLQEKFFERFNCELHNLYGPTEASIEITAWACQRLSKRRFVPIGRPIANTRTFVLDRSFQPAPIGVPGELFLGGVGVARGYLNRKGLTAEKFVPCPFGSEPGARIYRSGDRARYLPDGNIEFLGRLDHQVKIRGFRIELEEIETVLSRHPSVRQAVVTVREDTPGDQRLVAYYIPNLDRIATPADLRRFVETKLPAHSVPSVYLSLEAFPQTPSGKLDRQALPAPGSQRPELDHGIVAPRTPIEERLARLWCAVLGVQKIGIHDNFFELGGHSLLVTQLISRVRQAFRIDVPLPKVFQAPTIAKLATVIEDLLVAEISYLSDEETSRTAGPIG